MGNKIGDIVVLPSLDLFSSPLAAKLFGAEPPCATLMRGMARDELQQPQAVRCMTARMRPSCSETSGSGGPSEPMAKVLARPNGRGKKGPLVRKPKNEM